MKRALKLVAEFLAGFVALQIIALLLLVWRLSDSPVEATFLTSNIESGLEHLMPDTDVQIRQTLLVWDNKDRSIAIQGDDVKVLDHDNKTIANFPSVRVKLSAIAMLLGRFIPAELEIENPQLWMVRSADGSIMFGGMTAVEGAPPLMSKPAEPEAPVMVSNGMRRVIDDLTREGLLHRVAIQHAVMNIHDEQKHHDWLVSIPEVAVDRDRTGLTGKAQIDVSQRDHAALAIINYHYLEKDGTHHMALRFSDINPAFLAGAEGLVWANALDIPFTGEVSASFDAELKIIDGGVKVDAGAGKITAPDLWDEPRIIKGMTIDAAYDHISGQLKVQNSFIDFGGPKLVFSADGDRPEGAGPQDLAFTLNAKMTDLPMDQFATVWPKPFVPGAREWMSANMKKGTYNSADAVVKGKVNLGDIGNLTLESAEGKVSATNGTVTYLAGMPAVEGVNAEGSYDLNQMTLNLSGGGIGAVKLQPSTIQMTGFSDSVQNISLPIKLAGPVRDILKIIDNPPLGYASKVGLEPEKCDGQLDGTLTMQFPLLRSLLIKDMDIKAEARIANFSAGGLVPNIDITQGNLALNLTSEGFEIKGLAALNRVPLQISYAGNFTAAPDKPLYEATVSGAITGEGWHNLGVKMLEKIQGSTLADLRYVVDEKDFSHIEASLNFKQANVRVDEINWQKPVNVPATLHLAIDIPKGEDAEITDFELAGPQVSLKGTGTLDEKTMQPKSIDVDPMRVGRSNAKLHFDEAEGENGKLSFTVEGESFDISGISGGKEPAPSDPRPKDYNIKLKKLYTSKNGFISDVNAHARRDQLGWSEIKFSGKADGSHPLDIALSRPDPSSTDRVFDAHCDDFGKMLKGMGFSDNVRGGEFTLSGESSDDDPRIIEGRVEIGSFTVSDLPVLARLLSAASPFGFADLVTGNSSFDRLEGNYKWQGDAVDLRKMRATGSVFGINIEGHVDLNSSEANLHGTLVPFSFINGVLNYIPLIGSLMTGGEGQGVIAAAYTVKGSLSNPDINVNAASLLTPGIIRNLFFGNDDDVPKKKHAPAK